ncbi:carboxypeptidase-like regulatory domain-containing protein [Acidipila rosea]|nr:carboxypeptidase-like regulatory domain-containing protein [Acidipila rosea]
MHAQAVLKADASLPEAPVPQASVESQVASSMLTGTVADGEGAMIQGATITLENVATHDKRTALTDGSGSFTFSAVGPGLYAATIAARGFQPVVKTGISVHTGETYQLSQTTMQVATATTTVQVGVQTQYELAEAQLKAEEKQRFLWVVPNFYVSYLPNPASLTAGQKMRLALHAAVDPYQFINTGINAGWDQARNNYPGYGQGAAGYARRYGADYGDVVSGTIVGSGLMPALLHQDPRYFYKGTGSIPSRIGYALLAIVRTKGDNGKWQPNYSGLLGNLASGLIANSYLPTGDRKAVGNVIGVTFQGFALRGIGTLEEEFLARWVTTHARDKGTIGHQ